MKAHGESRVVPPLLNWALDVGEGFVMGTV